jgi:LytS/YehU family sensor histidine kinase
MEIVRNRLSPHFVFNAINAIMPSLKQHKELEHHFGLLVQMLRSNLVASEQIAATLSEETALVKNYLQLIRMVAG